MLVHLSLLALVLELEEQALVVQLGDVGLCCAYAAERHGVVPQRVEEVPHLLHSHHPRRVVERVAIVDAEAGVLDVICLDVAAGEELVVKHGLPGLFVGLVLPSLVVGVQLVDPEVQLLDLLLHFGVHLRSLLDLLVDAAVQDREVLEGVRAEVPGGLVLRPLEEHLRDPSHVALQVEVEPGDHLRHVVPLVLLVQEDLVLEGVHVGVRLVQVQNQPLLALPFVHHVSYLIFYS